MEDADKKDGNVEDDCCPICLSGDPEAMVRGPCRHEFCIPCVERVLTVPNTQMNHYWSPLIPNDEAHLNAPTLGRCPICRSEMSLFDLQRGPDSPLYAKNTDFAQSKLQGMVFIKNRCREGDESVHFPSSDEGSDALPYLKLDKVPQTLDDRSDLPKKKYFEPGCHFHEQTRTFHGSIRWGDDDCRKRFRGSAQWDFVLAFSSDLRFIARGVFVSRKEICKKEDCTYYACKFPLDGKWTVTWPFKRKTATLQVHGNMIYNQGTFLLREDPVPSELTFEDLEHPKLFWKDRDITQTVVSGVNLRTHPHGPAIGESIQWSVDDMSWTRQTMASDNPRLEVFHFGPDHPNKKHYQRLIVGVNNRTAPVMPTYVPNTVWGNTMCQAMVVGLASYHFMDNAAAGAYISYEHERTAVWPPLDNGMPVPSRMWFTEISFDAETRIFRGKIDWEGTHNTTWQGHRYWRYEMKFAEEFTCITGGSVRCVPRGSDEEMDMSIFGEELIYVNAGLLEQYRREAGTDDADFRSKIVHLSSSIRERIQNEGGSIRSIAMIQHVLLSAQRSGISYPSSLLD